MAEPLQLAGKCHGLFPFLLVLIFALGFTGCSCDVDDDDDDVDDDDDDDSVPGPDAGPVIWDEDTAWDDFQNAEHCVEQAVFSTAHIYYESAVAKLLDDNPFNDGPCPEGTLNRARYGATLCMITIPLKIIEGFMGSWLEGDDDAVADYLEKWYRDNHEIDPDDPLPRSIITDYLQEMIMPMVDEAVAWIDPVMDDPDFYYDMPQIKMTLFDTAFVIPDQAIDGRGRHGLAEASLFSWILHLASAMCRSVYAYNLDLDAPRIDEILQILMSGDPAEMLALLREYPDLLKLHTPDTTGINGAKYLLEAKLDWVILANRMIDDNDDDGIFGIDEINGYDPGELPDDLHDALHLDTGTNESSILRLDENNRLWINLRMNGSHLEEPDLGPIWDLLDTPLIYPLLDSFGHSFFGFYPPESQPDNGLDDDIAQGVSTDIQGNKLTDAAASYTPGALVGYVLNPNTLQNIVGHQNRTFIITANDSTSITADGDLGAVARAGDPYSVGDGEIDDSPLQLGLILSLIFPGKFPLGWELGVLPSAPFEFAPDFRDIIPLTDDVLGDPDLYFFVIDSTEWYEDLNDNGRYDPRTDVLHDAAHEYGAYSYGPDGLYQPSYMYFGEPTLGGMLFFETGLQQHEEHNLLNWLVFGLAEVEL